MQEAALKYDAAAIQCGVPVPAVPTAVTFSAQPPLGVMAAGVSLIAPVTVPMPTTFASPQLIAPAIGEPTTGDIASPELYPGVGVTSRISGSVPGPEPDSAGLFKAPHLTSEELKRALGSPVLSPGRWNYAEELKQLQSDAAIAELEAAKIEGAANANAIPIAQGAGTKEEMKLNRKMAAAQFPSREDAMKAINQRKLKKMVTDAGEWRW